MDILAEGFGFWFGVWDRAEDAFLGGPNFLFIVQVRVVGDLLELAGGGEGGAGGVEFENAAVMV